MNSVGNGSSIPTGIDFLKTGKRIIGNRQFKSVINLFGHPVFLQCVRR